MLSAACTGEQGVRRPMDKNISPVGWYVGTYLTRFIEIESEQNDDPESRFLSWENTVIVKADNLDQAYDKIELIGIEHGTPYEGGPERIPVKWEYLGIIDILPIYEELVDGAEIMWGSHRPRKLKNLRSLVKLKSEIYE